MRFDADRLDLAVHGDTPDWHLNDAGFERAAVLDLAVNVNPHGPPPGVREAAAAAAIERYPDRHERALLQALARHTGASDAAIVTGNGAAELLWLVVQCCSAMGDPVVVVEPTFSEVRRAAEAWGRDVVAVAMRADGSVDEASLAEVVTRRRPALVSLCRPNNPTGTEGIGLTDLAGLAAGSPDTIWIVDEAFLALSTLADDAMVQLPGNVIRVRSLTKDLAIPGLRLGYLLAAPGHAERLRGRRPPWTVSAPAQAAGVAGLDHWGAVEAARVALLRDRSALDEALAARGLVGPRSVTIFGLYEVGDATGLTAALRAVGVLVRDAASFGLPHHVRIRACDGADRGRLLTALDAVRGGDR